MINSVTWTLSAMLISEFFILSVLVRKERSFLYFYAPVFILVGLGVWKNTESADYKVWMTFITFGVLRAFIMTIVGIYSFLAAQRLSQLRLNSFAKTVLTIAELSLHVIAVLCTAYRGARYYRLFCTLVFAIAVAITLSQQSFTTQLLSRWAQKITGFLGEWSMTIYVTHMPIRDLFYKFYESPYDLYRAKYMYGIAVIVTSLGSLYLGRLIISVIPVSVAKLKEALTEDTIAP